MVYLYGIVVVGMQVCYAGIYVIVYLQFYFKSSIAYVHMYHTWLYKSEFYTGKTV